MFHVLKYIESYLSLTHNYQFSHFRVRVGDYNFQISYFLFYLFIFGQILFKLSQYASRIVLLSFREEFPLIIPTDSTFTSVSAMLAYVSAVIVVGCLYLLVLLLHRRRRNLSSHQQPSLVIPTDTQRPRDHQPHVDKSQDYPLYPIPCPRPPLPGPIRPPHMPEQGMSCYESPENLLPQSNRLQKYYSVCSQPRWCGSVLQQCLVKLDIFIK